MNDILHKQLGEISRTKVAAIKSPAPALFLHCAIFTASNHIVSDETFRLVSFEGQESVSQPFDLQLELHGNTSNKHGAALSFDDVVGRPVTVGIQYPSSFTQEQMADRFARAVRGGGAGTELSLFNGIVTSFSMEIPGVYRLGMKPALWRLSLTNNYEIHRQKNIRDAIAGILERHRVSYSMDAVSGDDNPAVARIQDWLQAGETDLDFIQRLMSKAHLYYYFTHTGNSHKLVFVNRTSYTYPPVFADKRPLRYTWTGEDDIGLAQSDVISQYSFQRSLVSSGVRGVFTRQEAAWEDDAVAQFQSFTASTKSNGGELPFNQYRIYQYGCSKEEVRHYTDATAEAMETSSNRFTGNSFCAHFRVGHQFRITGADIGTSHPSPVQASLGGRDFVLTQVKHQASADGGYRNDFEATQAAGFITSFSLQETQQGAVLAQVVPKSGDVPPQDWRYYTADYFDPETSALYDNNGVQHELEAKGVYVRFSTAPKNTPPVWVKLSPSMQTVPEIGVTVLVARAQDESELPEIQNIIQANGSMVIMPSKWTANTHVGSGYSTNYGDGQRISFGTRSKADVKRAFGITDTAYKTDKYRDTSYSQGASYGFSCADSEAARTPDKSELFGKYGNVTDLLSASESFGSNFGRQYSQVSSSFSNIGISYGNSTIGKSESYSTIGKSESYTTITGTSYSETTHGGDITSITTINANSESTSTQKGDNTSTNTVTGASRSTATYNGTVTSTANHHGAVTSTTHHYDNVTSTNIVDGVSRNTNRNHLVVNLGTTAAQTSSNAIGATNSNDVTGVANSNSAVGVSVAINAAVNSNSVSATGVHAAINMTGLSASVELAGPGYSYSNRAANPRLETIDFRLTLVEIMQIFL